MDAREDPARWWRRALTVPGLILLWLLTLGTLPATLVLALLVDLLRPRSFAALRLLAALVAVLTLHVVGLGLLFLGWVGGLRGGRARERRLDAASERWFARKVWSAVVRLFSLEVTVDGAEALVDRGPVVVLARHASLVDVLLPIVLACAPSGLAPKIVAKRELLWDPCVDLVGHRLAGAFVRRGGRDSAGDREAIAALAESAGPDDAIVLFPEGTRFSAARRERAIAALRAAEPDAAARAERLLHVLPPRLGGTLTVLAEAPPADVIFCAHTGLEGARTLADLLGGVLVERAVQVRLWRVPARDVPTNIDDRVEWLWRWWECVDAWIATRREGPALAPVRGARRVESRPA